MTADHTDDARRRVEGVIIRSDRATGAAHISRPRKGLPTPDADGIIDDKKDPIMCLRPAARPIDIPTPTPRPAGPGRSADRRRTR